MSGQPHCSVPAVKTATTRKAFLVISKRLRHCSPALGCIHGACRPSGARKPVNNAAGPIGSELRLPSSNYTMTNNSEPHESAAGAGPVAAERGDPTRVATALAYGILSDTLNLYRAMRPDVAQTYLSILHRADMHALALIQNPVHSKSFFVTLGRCIRKAMVYRRLIVAHLGVIKHPDLVSQMAEFLLTYKEAGWSLCTGRYKGRLHVSLRSSKQDGQAGEVLQDAFVNRKQAGGHGAIAGGSCRVGADAPEEVWHDKQQALQERLLKRLRISIKGEPRTPFVP